MSNKMYNESTDSEEIKNLFAYLQESDNKTVANSKICLVLGVTGTGKSTLVQHVAGDDSKLYSIEVDDESDEFIIVDDSHISNSTTESKTLIPELIYDRRTDTNFYDCPGFSDTRGIVTDITAAYLIQKLITCSEYIKIVFTVSYQSVRRSVDRFSFMNLVKHAITLIKDVRKYSNSLALVVTKVDNIQRRGVLINDEIIIKKIGDFLLEVRHELIINYESIRDNIQDDERIFYNQAINFIQILASKTNDRYDRIALFRRPNKRGPLSEISLLKRGKKQIKNLIHENLKYTKVDPTDFGYTISEKSKNRIYMVLTYLTDEIRTNMHCLINEIKNAYEIKIKTDSKCYQILTTKINEDYSLIMKSLDEINNKASPRQFLLLLLQLLDNIGIQLPENNFKNILDLDSYLTFTQKFHKSKERSLIFSWKNILSDLEKFLEEWKFFISFLLNVNTFMSDYRVLQNINLLSDIYEAFDSNNFIKILTDSQLFDKQILNSLNDMKINELMTSMLRDLITLRKQMKIEKWCLNGNSVRIQGEFVQLSEMNSIQCWNNNTNFIEIFASDTIYIDQDFMETKKKMHITIIAPTWQIIGRRKIIFDGAPGLPHNISKAKSGIFPSGKGDNGIPGKPGKSGGTFLGIGMKFVNGENFLITSNGGIGGPGQDGGDGANGRDGQKINLPNGKNKYLGDNCCHHIFNDTYAEVNSWIDRKSFFTLNMLSSHVFESYGTIGVEGGDGGHGGVGGLGGEPGDIQIIELEQKSKIVIEMKKGARGIVGNGGVGGQGGFSSKTLVKCVRERIVERTFTHMCLEEFFELEHIPRFKKLRNGNDGKITTTSIILEQPEAGTVLQNILDTITNYLHFAKSKFDNKCNNDYFSKFLEKFHTNSYIRNILNSTKINFGNRNQINTKKFLSPYEKLRANLITPKRQRRFVRSEHLSGINEEIRSSLIISNQPVTPNKISSAYNNNSFQPYLVLNQHFVNNTFLLVDVLIRKLTKTKYPIHHQHNEISNGTAQALTLNILKEFENMLSENVPVEILHNYNPIETQTKLFKLIINNKFIEIPKYLTDTAFNITNSDNQNV